MRPSASSWELEADREVELSPELELEPKLAEPLPHDPLVADEADKPANEFDTLSADMVLSLRDKLDAAALGLAEPSLALRLRVRSTSSGRQAG